MACNMLVILFVGSSVDYYYGMCVNIIFLLNQCAITVARNPYFMMDLILYTWRFKINQTMFLL